MGPVIPARRVSLMPEVSGRVVSLDPAVIPGGLVQAVQELLRIDPRDYEAVLEQRRGERAQATLTLKLDRGNQRIARQEYALLGQEMHDDERELVLREPHLASAEAALRATESMVARAQLDLERCRVTAPFNGVIQDKNVDIGARVSPTNVLLSLAGTDTFWVEANVRVDDLKWLKIPTGNDRNGSPVKVTHQAAWGLGIWRSGRVIRRLPDVEPQGQLARLLIAIDDPLSLQDENSARPCLLLGSVVRVEIQGRELTGGVPLRWEVLRDGDHVWIMTPEETLEIRPVEIVYRGKQRVYVTGGLQAGERIVVTDMAAAMAGMPLRLEGTSPDRAQAGSSTGSGGKP
jgi:RND family efflux transporter MFP subunit